MCGALLEAWRWVRSANRIALGHARRARDQVSRIWRVRASSRRRELAVGSEDLESPLLTDTSVDNRALELGGISGADAVGRVDGGPTGGIADGRETVGRGLGECSDSVGDGNGPDRSSVDHVSAGAGASSPRASEGLLRHPDSTDGGVWVDQLLRALVGFPP